MEDIYREVRFDEYCSKCKNQAVDENKEPCDICLSNPLNEYTDKPVKFEDR